MHEQKGDNYYAAGRRTFCCLSFWSWSRPSKKSIQCLLTPNTAFQKDATRRKRHFAPLNFARCLMERPATDDDVIACPSCESRDGLTIKWIPELDFRVHERTEIGCAACGIWFSAKEDRWAIAEWNNFAIDGWHKKGIEQPNAELYRLLLAHYHDEMAERASAHAVDAWLTEHVVPLCPFGIGDRFEARVYPGGAWSVRGIKAVYGINTGPFWIIEAKNVQPNGRLGDDQHQFWQRDAEHFIKLPPFWRPTRWSQVVAGDTCVYRDGIGTLIEVDTPAKIASVSIEGDIHVIRSLTNLYVPTVRFEAVTGRGDR